VSPRASQAWSSTCLTPSLILFDLVRSRLIEGRSFEGDFEDTPSQEIVKLLQLQVPFSSTFFFLFRDHQSNVENCGAMWNIVDE
jgi:hypothetical protein